MSERKSEPTRLSDLEPVGVGFDCTSGDGTKLVFRQSASGKGDIGIMCRDKRGAFYFIADVDMAHHIAAALNRMADEVSGTEP